MSFESTPLYGGNAEFLDALYEQYLHDPASVEAQWRALFDSLAAPGEQNDPVRQARSAGVALPAPPGVDGAAGAKQAAVSRLVQIWTNRGHLLAKLDPLGLMQRPRPRVLDLEYFGLGESDLECEFFTGSRTVAIPKRLSAQHSGRA